MTGPASSAAVSWPPPTWVTRPPSVVGHAERPYPPTPRYRYVIPRAAHVGARLPERTAERFRGNRHVGDSAFCPVQRIVHRLSTRRRSAAELATHHPDDGRDLAPPQRRGESQVPADDHGAADEELQDSLAERGQPVAGQQAHDKQTEPRGHGGG